MNHKTQIPKIKFQIPKSKTFTTKTRRHEEYLKSQIPKNQITNSKIKSICHKDSKTQGVN